MLSRREDGHHRTPSPSPSRRQIWSRDDPYGTKAEYRSGGYRKAPSREPSPGGVGRLSTSAPAGWDPPSLQNTFALASTASSREGGGYYGRELQMPVSHSRVLATGSTLNQAASSFSSSSVSSSTLRKQASPKANGHVSHQRPASASSSSYGSYYVNGDSMLSSVPHWAPAGTFQPGVGGPGRPLSFPPTQPAATAAPVAPCGWRATGKASRGLISKPITSSSSGSSSSAPRLAPGSPAHRREEQGSVAMQAGATGPRQESSLGQPRSGENAMRGGGVRGSAAPCDPTGRRSSTDTHSDEALSSVTLTEARALRDAERLMTGYQEGSFTSDDGYTWHSALTCYLCGQLFRRPRILPCGHTFCSDCLAQLKDELLREGRRMPGGPHAVCTWSPPAGKVEPGAGLQFICPMPDCRYAMRLMNLTRWSTRNKAVMEAVSALRKMYENRQDASTQTDITLESVLVTIPRSLIQLDTPAYGPPDERGRGLLRRHSGTLADRVMQRALSMDCLSRSYIPQPHAGWRSYVAMLGMHILQQIIHT